MIQCYDVGINGNCGATCPVFKRGDCEEPAEFSREYVIAELGDEAEDVMSHYKCFDIEIVEITIGSV
jgi:hypothetical protein